MSSFVPSAITEPFFELQTPDFAWTFICTVLTIYEIFLSGTSEGGGAQGRQGVTQPFFELQTPYFAWNFLCTVQTNYEQKFCQGHQKGGVRGVKEIGFSGALRKFSKKFKYQIFCIFYIFSIFLRFLQYF